MFNLIDKKIITILHSKKNCLILVSCNSILYLENMGGSFQDYNVMFSIESQSKMMNSAGNNSFSDLVSVYLNVFDH